jgi:signal transduction histidine kinase
MPRPDVDDRRHRGGLRLRLTLLSTLLLALIGALLLGFAYLVVGRVVSSLPQLPPGTQVQIGDRVADAADVAAEVAAEGRQTVLVVGLIAFPLQVLAGAFVSWMLIGRALRPLSTLTREARVRTETYPDRLINFSGPRDEVSDLAESFDDMISRLHSALEAERRFAANASHELRTPLAVIRTEVDVTLADPQADTAELRRMAEVVREATDRADALLSSLLLLARTQARGLAVQRPTDLAELVEPALRAIAAEIEQRRLTVKTEADPAVLYGDPALLERLVGNLVENAVRHNVADGWVRVVTESDGRRVRLVVSSSGAAVEASAVSELFEPFRQGARARTTRGGTGLGLSIVQAVVAAHGGTVWAQPVSPGGLAVTVELPVGKPAEAAR